MKKGSLLSILIGFTTLANGQLIYSDNFESYTTGSLIANTEPLHWNTYSSAPGGPEDCEVDDAYAHSGTQSIKVLQTIVGGGPDNLLLLLGDSTSGAYTLSWYMYIPSGKGGNLSIQHIQDAPGVELAADLTFYTGGG